MSKKRAIISYDKLTIDQKKQILKDFPDGYINHLTSIKIPTSKFPAGEMMEALIWETEEVIYLVKINKSIPKPAAILDEEEDDFDDEELEKVDVKDDELDSDDEDEPDYDKPEEDEEDEDE